ncbi:hypothetical protein GCM10023115_06870 [Pontixanthobacter gangjinensis]|uniref:Cupin domain-containing protein n=1 Tax=Pontixanthobacter gangjinensis TaxID=1028742 RepID=A0A6I4SJU9_9SPHN|nr:cupin domain-containing protein [Pontixanthobacter gangjinensis]MXO55935.1 cupin domain-containing protein [Pontixanthobacter gangjinensis]
MNGPHKLAENWAHLGLGATSEVQPAFSGMDWYKAYGQRNASDGAEGRLVSLHRFTESWDVWEMHPVGSEMVICISGSIVLIQETNDGQQTIALAAGEYAINPAGIWHTADIVGPAEAIFITAGQGTEHRSR